MSNPEENKDGEPLEIRVVRRGNIVQSGGEKSYGFILLLLVVVGIFVYVKWFKKSGDGTKADGRQPSAEIVPGKPSSAPARPEQHDIPIPSETGGK